MTRLASVMLQRPLLHGGLRRLHGMATALQPIVNIHTGACYGFEALTRDVDRAGFSSIKHLLDSAHEAGLLQDVETILHGKAMCCFSQVPDCHKYRLFLNADSRAVANTADFIGNLHDAMSAHHLPDAAVLLEISERHPLSADTGKTTAILQKLRKSHVSLAIDDFGTGFSGLQLLYFATPEVIKIDRFFIADIAKDAKKRFFLAQIVNMAHVLGARVLAEGVETAQEYYVCKEIGCDLVQGYLVQPPTTRLEDLREHYAHIAELSQTDRRTAASTDHRLIRSEVSAIPPMPLDTGMEDVFERFRANKSCTFFPVVGSAGEPLGIVREADLKEYAYSRYGQALISNKTLGRKLSSFLIRCPVADINSKAEHILEVFSTAQGGEGIIIVDTMRYVGFLSASSLLHIINEKNLTAAREQNPLTRLPGNNAIHEFVSQALEDVDGEYAFVYFDFDNFKPFNDTYGFRLGDRAILLFAETLTKLLPAGQCFAGHVGGDDFFGGFRGMSRTLCETLARTVVQHFSAGVQCFYDDDTRRAGFMNGHDRQGNPCRFPLLGVSAAILHLAPGRRKHGINTVSTAIADAKSQAKHATENVYVACLE